MFGETFTGEPEDIARWYCKRRHIKLYIKPNMDKSAEKNSFVLLAAFPYSSRLTHIAYFKNVLYDNDIETAFRLFFYEYLCEGDDPDYEMDKIS